MHPFVILLAAGIAADSEAIVVTAAREPLVRSEAPASVSLLDASSLELLDLPLAGDALRLMPGVAVSVSGPAGSQTQLRIRGAEASHSLLFVDGIRFNDPAAGNEARFELLGTDLLSRMELIRGPQSALWGAEALGGVVAVDSADPLQGQSAHAIAEYGSNASARLAAQGRIGSETMGIAGSAALLRSDGIDAFGAGGERDGFVNRAASLKAKFAPAPGAEIGVVGHVVDAKSQYDGFDPATFLRANTLDTTHNRILASRFWTHVDRSGWALKLDASLLSSRNRNALDGDPVNATFGRRSSFGAQISRGLSLGGTDHRLTLAAEHQRERFRATDDIYGGATGQKKSRRMTGLVAEWRADWSPLFATDVALRRDEFSAFADATTLRASLLVRPTEGWRLHAAYGEGIAQPSFYDLFGFFPGFFVGNPALKAERGNSWEAGLRWSDAVTHVAFTAYTGKLSDEIVDTFDPATFLSSTANAPGKSRRRGLEFEAGHSFGSRATLNFNYSYLDADDRQTAGLQPLKEVRRARHSANLTGLASFGAARIGASIAYVGKRADTNFDVFPARRETLGNYLLASLSAAWEVSEGVEAFGRIANAFDADYQDAIGYATPGRTVHAGLRLRLGD